MSIKVKNSRKRKIKNQKSRKNNINNNKIETTFKKKKK